jgi:hypothetical protein
MRNRSQQVLRVAALVSGAFALTLAPTLASAQTPFYAPAPCHLQACGLVIDWGSGKTSATYPADRKYGSGDDFEAKIRTALADHGFKVKDAPADGPLALTMRPTMRAKVMCDAMAGTNSDKNCTAMTDLAVTFASADTSVKAPGAMRIANRCGGSDTYMTMNQFAQYSADMIYYNLEGAAKKEPRPVSKCY